MSDRIIINTDSEWRPMLRLSDLPEDQRPRFPNVRNDLPRFIEWNGEFLDTDDSVNLSQSEQFAGWNAAAQESGDDGLLFRFDGARVMVGTFYVFRGA